MLSARRPTALIAAAVFAFLWLRPAYTVLLRRGLREKLPEYWDHLSSNGGYAFLLPQMALSRYHDESVYAARLNQVLLHGVPYSAYWTGHHEFGVWGHDFIIYYLMGAVGLLAGGNITATWLAVQALTAALWFVLLESVFYWWCGRRSVSAPLALFALAFPDLFPLFLDINFNLGVNWDRFVSIFFQSFTARPNFFRLPSPFLSYLVMSWLFVAAWRLAARKTFDLWLAALLGAGFGLMSFVHAFEHVFSVATLTCFAAALHLAKAPEQARKNITAAVVVAGLVSAGYYLAMHLALDPDAVREMMSLQGLLHTRRFYKITVVHLALAGVGWRWQRREAEWPRKLGWLLFSAAQAAVFLCRNTQVLTGIYLQGYHFIALGSFMGCAMCLAKLADWAARRNWWDRRIGVAAGLLVAAAAFYNEKSAAEQSYATLGLSRDVDAAMKWVRANAPDDALFLSLSMITNETLPIYTQAKVQVPPVSAPFSVIFTREQYFRRTAELLKTVDADPDRFTAARWVVPAEQKRLITDEAWRQRILQQVHEPAMEPLEWGGCFPYGGADEGPILEARARIRALYDEVAPLPGPYYIWVNERDEALLKRSPAASGAKLVYANATVKIFSSRSGA